MCLKYVTHKQLGLDHDVAEHFRLRSDSRRIPTTVLEKHGFPGFFFMFFFFFESCINICVSGMKEVLHLSEAAIPSSLLS